MIASSCAGFPRCRRSAIGSSAAGALCALRRLATGLLPVTRGPLQVNDRESQGKPSRADGSFATRCLALIARPLVLHAGIEPLAARFVGCRGGIAGEGEQAMAGN